MSGGSTQHHEVPPPTPPDPYAPPRSGTGRTRPGTRTRPGERTPPNGGNGGNGHGTGGEGDATVGVYLEGDAVGEWVSMYGDFELAMAAGDADWDIEPWAPFDAAGGPDEDGYAVEIRAERLRHQSVGTAVRSGELDVFEIGGSEGNSDVVAGVDRVRISGHLFERTGRSMVLLADQYILEVDGKLDVHSHWEEGVMMAGAMEETWSDGGAIFCAMSDDLIAGGGLRCSGPLDLWVHGLMGAEERPGSAFADGVLLELSGTHYEREWGHGAHLMGLGVYSATVYQTQVSDFRQLMKVSFGVRNILPGGGGGAGEPGVTPPPGAMAAAGGPGLVMALPMFVGSLALSATRLSGAIKRFGDVAALRRLVDAAATLEDLSALRRTTDLAASLDDVTAGRHLDAADDGSVARFGVDADETEHLYDNPLEALARYNASQESADARNVIVDDSEYATTTAQHSLYSGTVQAEYLPTRNGGAYDPSNPDAFEDLYVSSSALAGDTPPPGPRPRPEPGYGDVFIRDRVHAMFPPAKPGTYSDESLTKLDLHIESFDDNGCFRLTADEWQRYRDGTLKIEVHEVVLKPKGDPDNPRHYIRKTVPITDYVILPPSTPVGYRTTNVASQVPPPLPPPRSRARADSLSWVPDAWAPALPPDHPIRGNAPPRSMSPPPRLDLQATGAFDGVPPIPDDFDFLATHHRTLVHLKKAQEANNWRSALAAVDALENMRAVLMQSFIKFGGDAAALPPGAFANIQEAYKQLQRMAVEADAAGRRRACVRDQGRAQDHRQRDARGVLQALLALR